MKQEQMRDWGAERPLLSPVGGLTLSAVPLEPWLQADAVSGIMLSIAFSQLCWVEKVTFGFLLNNC